MKCLTLKWLALKIEYHWWRIGLLRNKPQSDAIVYQSNLHRYKAHQLQELYEVTAGIRDFGGVFIAKANT